MDISSVYKASYAPQRSVPSAATPAPGRAVADSAGQASPSAAISAALAPSASYAQALASLATLLGMATAPTAGPRDQISSPLMALSLTAPPANTQPGPGLLLAPDGDEVLDVTPDAIANQIVDKLGSDGSLSLADAQKALVGPHPGHAVNSAEAVAHAFAREDINHDGRLSQAELTKLMSYYMDNSRPMGPAVKLPSTWA